MSALSALAALAFASNASAQTPPAGVALGLERAFGLEISSETTEAAGTEVTNSRTTFGLGLTGGATPFSVTRLGVDYILDNAVSIGTGVGFVTYSSQREANGVSEDGPSITRFVFAPRVGYFAMLGDSIGLWPRGGITYASTGVKSTTTNPVTLADMTNESSETDLALTLEAPLMLMPAKNFGFMIAPVFDYVLSHSEEVGGTESDADGSLSSFGIQFGIAGVL